MWRTLTTGNYTAVKTNEIQLCVDMADSQKQDIERKKCITEPTHVCKLQRPVGLNILFCKTEIDDNLQRKARKSPNLKILITVGLRVRRGMQLGRGKGAFKVL